MRTVKVTEEDIQQGQHAYRLFLRCGGAPSTHTCAVALALKRTFSTDDATWGYTEGNVNKVKIKSLNPYATRDFVIRHDTLQHVEPFEFRVELA